jgi:MFS family permease
LAEGAAAAAAPAVRGARSAFAPLRERNFRLLWTGLLISQTGSWMQFIALGYLVDQLTKAPIYLGLLGLSQAVPRLLFAFIGGVAADRFDRRRVLMLTNLALMASAFLLAYLAYTDTVRVWHVLAIGAFNSFAQSFDNPARQSLVPMLVRDGQLISALSLTSMALNGSGVFGPSLGGVVIAIAGVKACFFLNAVSFIAVVIALVRMEFPPQRAVERDSVAADIREGLKLLTTNSYLLTLLGLVGVMNFFGRPYIRLMPAVAREVLGVGPTGLGLLQAAPPLGTIAAVFIISGLGATVRHGKLMLMAAFTTGMMVVLFALSHWFAVSMVLLVLAGTGTAVSNATANTLVQTSVQPAQRGRVMGLYNMVTFGMFSLGTLPIGALAGAIGVSYAIAVGGATAALLIAVLALTSPKVASL